MIRADSGRIKQFLQLEVKSPCEAAMTVFLSHRIAASAGLVSFYRRGEPWVLSVAPPREHVRSYRCPVFLSRQRGVMSNGKLRLPRNLTLR
jgi:hypothetical protein